MFYSPSLLYTTFPNKAPIPVVKPIASAPHNVTRTTPFKIDAPPVRAAIAPNSARKISETIFLQPDFL